MINRARRRNGAAAPGGDGKRDRRAEIITALYRAMIDKGFSDTSLSDLAKGAGISVSHLLYYFSSKEQILEALAQETVDHVRETFEASRGSRPEEQCRALADFNFAGPAGSPTYRMVALDLMAASAHDHRLRRLSRQNARLYRNHLRDIFRRSPRAFDLGTDDAALIAGALWMGLFVNSEFQPELTRKRAHRLFLRAILQLAGLAPGRSLRGTASTPRDGRPARRSRGASGKGARVR